MKKQFKLFTLLLIPLILASCGGDSQTPKVSTKLSFNIGQLAITASNGGAMIYGQSLDGAHRFSRRIDTAAEFNIDLPKGAWDFYTLAWTGSTELSGSALCATNKNVNLSENDTQILIQLTNANCANDTESSFSPLKSSFKKIDNGVEKNYFAQTQVTSCSDIQKFQNSGVNGCADQFKGHTNSVKIIYPEITQFDNADLSVNFDNIKGLRSKCYNLSNGAQSSDVFSENLPLGNASSPLFTVIRSYYGSNVCDDDEVHGFMEIQLEKGLAQAESSVEVATAPAIANIFHTAIAVSANDVCDSVERTAQSFGYESSNGHQEIGVCNATQFNNIAANYLKNPSVSIFLLTDIDFAHGPFVPIGDDIKSNKTLSGAFEGNFYGGNFQLKNIDIHASDASEVGIFRHLSGAVIRDLNILDSVVESRATSSALTEKIGLLAGVNTNSPSIFKNIKADIVHISGGKNIGGLIGLADQASVELGQVQIEGSIQGQQDAIGGLIGEIRSTLATIHQSSFDGISVTTNGQYAGGLIGKISNGQNNIEINQSFVKGYVKAKSHVGGLVGGIFTDDAVSISPAISDSYVQAAIISLDTARPYAGGLVGYSQADSSGVIDKFNITNSFMAHSYLSLDGVNTGGATGNAATCSNVFIASTKDSGCGSEKTLDQLYTQSTYSAVGFDFDTAGSWIHPDPGNDLPHLKWEDHSNYACSGKYAVAQGSGSATDPKWICNTTQFLNMTAGTHYILKRDLDFKTDPAGTGTHTIALITDPGQYFLDGNNHHLLNTKILVVDKQNHGIFSHLTAGSVVKNLRVGNLKMEFSGSLTGQTKFGTIAAINAGELSNISVFNSLQSIHDTAISTPGTYVLVGGLVSENTSAGIISYSSSWTKTITKNITINDATSHLKYGGIASDNYGKIQYSQAAGLFSYKSATGADDSSSSNFLIGGLVGFNNGEVLESQVSREAVISFNNSSPSASVSLGGISYKNSGSITDVSVRPHLKLGSNMGDISNTFGLFAVRNYGTITRSFYIEDPINAADEFPVAVVGSPVKLKVLGAGAINDSFCSINNVSSGGCAKAGHYRLSTGDLSVIDTSGAENFNSSNYTISENFIDPTSTWSMQGLNNSGDSDEAPEVQKINQHVWELGLNGIGDGNIVDSTLPKVLAVRFASADDAYPVGSVIDLIVTFSKDVDVTGTPRVLLETGAIDRFATYSSGSGSAEILFKYTTIAGDAAADLDYLATNSLGLNSGSILDSANKVADLTLPIATTLSGAHNIVIDTTVPNILSAIYVTADRSYGVGEEIHLKVVFDEAVFITGTPQIQFETGATDRFANYLSGTGTSDIIFKYIVQAADSSTDLDYLTDSSLALNGGFVRDVADNNAVLTLPALGTLATNHAIEIETVAPTVQSVAFLSSNATYPVGSVIDLKVTFSESVDITGQPKVQLETGVTDRFAIYDSGSGTADILFKYTVVAGDIAADLTYISVSSLTLNSGTILDPAKNVAGLNLPAPTTLSTAHNIVIDTNAPSISSVTFLTVDNSYGVGEEIDLKVIFDEAISVTGLPKIQFETGTTDRYAIYVSGDGTTDIIFKYTVQAGDTSGDLDYLTSSSLILNGGTLKDSSTNNAALALPAAGTLLAAHAIVIETTAPTVTSVAFLNADGSYPVGTVIDLKVTFSENVFITNLPKIELETGATNRFAYYDSGSATNQILFKYIVTAGDVAADLSYVSVSSLTLNTGAILDASNNVAILTLPAHTGLISSHDIVIDTSVPVVASVGYLTVNGKYGVGEVIDLKVVFNEVVIVTGSPKIELGTGPTNRFAYYDSGTGSTDLLFKYTVQTTDISANLDYLSTTSLVLNSGTLQDLADNNATLTLPNVGDLPLSHNIEIETAAPTVVNVNFLNIDGTYPIGAVIDLQVTFSEIVDITNTPQIELDTGATNRFATYDSGSGTNLILFKYTVVASDTSLDLDYPAIGSLSANGGTILDQAKNVAVLDLLAVGTLAAAHAIIIDTSGPSISSVDYVNADGLYGIGSIIDLQVTFDQAVTVTGLPQVQLETGATDRFAVYQSGTGTNNIFFRYTVIAGDSAADLDYLAITSLDLNSGTMENISNINASLTLPTVGTLAAARAIEIETTIPIVTAVSFLNANGAYPVGTVIDLRVTFSEIVNVTGTPKIQLETGATDQYATYDSGGGSTQILFKYTVAAADGATDLDYTTTSIDITGGTILDLAGNSANVALPAIGDLGGNHNIVIDTLAPSVSSIIYVTADGTYAPGQAIEVKVTFDEPVFVIGTPRLELATTPAIRYADYESGAGTTDIIFKYIVQSGDTSGDLDYMSNTSLELNGGTMKDIATNDATRALSTPPNLSNTYNILVAAAAINQPPVLDSITDIDLNSGSALNIDAGDSGNDLDADNQSLTYTCFYDNTPDGTIAGGTPCANLAGLTFVPATGIISGTITIGQEQVYEFHIEASDGAYTDTEFFVITVTTNYYVRKNGSDGNDCLSPSTACLTIQAAVTKSEATNNSIGDRIYVGSGVYSENISITTGSIVSPNNDGALSFHIIADIAGTHTSAPAGLVVFDGAKAPDMTKGILINNAHYVIIDGFEIRNYYYSGIFNLNSTYNKYHNIKTHHNGGAGIHIEGAFTQVKNILTYKNMEDGIKVNIDDVDLSFVTAYQNEYSGIMVTLGLNNINITNSILTKNLANGLEGSTPMHDYNIVSNNEQGNFSLPLSKNTNEYIGDPKFQDAARSLFKLIPGSSAINGGSDSALNLFIDTYTTAADSSLDNGTADIGYHYSTADIFPVANINRYYLAKNKPIVINLNDLNANNITQQTSLITPIRVDSNSHTSGTITDNGTSLTYTPATNFIGPDFFQVQIEDANGNKSIQNVNIIVHHEWFVRKGAPDDSGNCSTPETACLTIQGAVDKMLDNQPNTIWVGIGIYEEALSILKNGGDILKFKLESRIIADLDGLKTGDGVGAVILDGTNLGASLNGISINGNDNIMIEGFNIKNYNNGIYLANSKVIRLKGLQIFNNSLDGINTFNSSFDFFNKIVSHSNGGNGINIDSNMSKIDDSITYGNNFSGILSTSNFMAFKNILTYGNNSDGLGISTSGDYSKISFMTSYGNTYNGMYVRSGANDVNISNSIIFQNTYGIFGSSTHSYNILSNTTNYSGTSADIGESTGNPNFFNINGADAIYKTNDDNFRLPLSSPAIDAGSNSAIFHGMDQKTTRNDNSNDSGIVDMGFHYDLP